MAEAKTCDPSVYALAKSFIDDIKIHKGYSQSIPELTNELALEIQQTIEDFCQGLDQDPDAIEDLE